MAYVTGTIPTSFLGLDPGRERLSDNLVGLVLPRAPGARNNAGLVESNNLLENSRSGDAPSIAVRGPLISLAGPSQNKATTRSTSLTGVKRTAQTSPMELIEVNKKITRKHREMSRREQCRANQARYRSSQRELLLQLERSVKRLSQEVGHLKRGYEGALSHGKPKQFPWAIVVEVFRLLEDSICSPWRMMDATDEMNDAKTQRRLQEWFSPDVAMGDLLGVDALTEQLRRFSLNFGDSKLQLQRIKTMAPGVMIATARLGVTVTELTIRNVFPNLSKRRRQEVDYNYAALREQLLGQRLNCSSSTTFLFHEGTGRIERLEVNIDLVGPLLRVFGTLGAVASALVGMDCSLAL